MFSIFNSYKIVVNGVVVNNFKIEKNLSFELNKTWREQTVGRLR
jgi:hypothetical protein